MTDPQSAAAEGQPPTALPHARITTQAAAVVRRGYPWIFAGQIMTCDRALAAGDLVEVRDPEEQTLGFAYANPKAQLALRMLYSPAAGARYPDGVPDERVELGRKLDRAWTRRQELKLDSDAVRLIWSEADGLPGVVCDRFADLAVVQFLTAGAERRRDLVIEWLASHLKPRGIFERSLGPGRSREGLPPHLGWAWLPTGAAEPDPVLTIQEGPLRFRVDVAGGQKTGFYLDQRAARRLLQEQRLQGSVLDCFCYTGGFAVSAAFAGAERVVAVDSSAPALELLAANAALNGYSGRIQPVRAKAFTYLTQAAERGETFQTVILDPPAFARNRAQRARALAGYRELHRRAAQLLAPGGSLLTCSCSHVITPRDLKASVLAGARDGGRRLKVLSEFGPDADHPHRSQVPESRYLACLFARLA
jgi:23S rRNA (cytosine1962-C5)-methyltransferase